jgi:putative hydrolase of the HAD superfamily
MNIDLLLFDLDDTLYASSSGIWTLIRERIDLFMISKLGYTQENVHSIREKFFRTYGTTLRGLESIHHIDPVEYLHFVHDVPIQEYLSPNSKLDTMLTNIKQRKVIFTNGDRWHAKRVTDALQVSKHFHQIIDVLDVSPYCKPMIESFKIAFDQLGILEAQNVLFIDDNLRNVQMAEKLGMQTVWVTEIEHNPNGEYNQIKKIEDLLDIYPDMEFNRVY